MRLKLSTIAPGALCWFLYSAGCPTETGSGTVTLLQSIASLVYSREALAEAVLHDALQTERGRQAFSELLRLASVPRASVVGIEGRQRWSKDRTRRHDIVLKLRGRNTLQVELKGDAPFTAAQVRALAKGRRGARDNQIHVVVAPRNRPGLNELKVPILYWDDIDRKVLPRMIRGVADLWLGAPFADPRKLKREANAYIRRCLTGEDASWMHMWTSVMYVRDRLGSRLEFSRAAGSKLEGAAYYYGANVCSRRTSKLAWLGWLFRRKSSGAIDIALVLQELEPKVLRRGANRQLLPAWFDPLNPEWAYCVPLWSSEEHESGHVDLDAVARVVAKSLS